MAWVLAFISLADILIHVIHGVFGSDLMESTHYNQITLVLYGGLQALLVRRELVVLEREGIEHFQTTILELTDAVGWSLVRYRSLQQTALMCSPLEDIPPQGLER